MFNTYPQGRGPTNNHLAMCAGRLLEVLFWGHLAWVGGGWEGGGKEIACTYIHTYMHTHVYTYVYVCAYVCAYV